MVSSVPVDVSLETDTSPDGWETRLISRKVALRLETPAEILEEDSEMKQDIESALEHAGMTLADFEATSDDDSEERSDRESKERTLSGSQDRTGGTEETLNQGRLLNRIV